MMKGGKHATSVLIGMVVMGTFMSTPMMPQQSLSRDERIARAVEGLREKLISLRRDFHTYPELSNREERTARIVADELRRLGLEVRTAVARHGVVALLRGATDGPVVAYRADMDALPIAETIDVPYRSKNPGVKHACGHDAHTAIGLGVAAVLSQMRDQIRGSIKFLFQPAEEGPPPGEEGGAPLMIKEGALDNPRPAAIFGLHCDPRIDVGKIGYHIGPAMASSDRFVITIRGRKVHGAYPHEGIDAVVVAAQAILALQTIRSRRTDTQHPLVLTIGSIHGGNRFNIITDEVVMEGTVRTHDEGVRAQVKEFMHQTLKGVASAFGASYEMTYEEGAHVTYNDPLLVEESLPSFRRILGEANLVTPKPHMGAEDFSYYARLVPGFFFFLGVRNEAKGIRAMIHTPEFDIDEEALPLGVKVAAAALLDYLDRHAQRTAAK
jgi:amidohydrolase